MNKTKIIAIILVFGFSIQNIEAQGSGQERMPGTDPGHSTTIYEELQRSAGVRPQGSQRYRERRPPRQQRTRQTQSTQVIQESTNVNESGSGY